MTDTTPHGRILATVAGTAFTVGSLVILMGDVLTSPGQWSQYHALTVLTVFGTIAAGHLMATASRAKHFLAALGFGVLFIAGTLLVVHNSVGRQAAVHESSTLSVESQNKLIGDKTIDLAKARQRLADAEKMVDLETGKGGCRSNCKDWKQRGDEVRSHIKVIEGELTTLGAPAPVDAKSQNMAAVLALFGFNEAKSKVALLLIEPFLWTLFFEIGSIVSLGFAFRSAPVAANDNPSERDRSQTSFPAPPLPPVSAIPETVKGADVINWAREFEKRHGRKPRLDEAQNAFPHVSRTTAYRRIKTA